MGADQREGFRGDRGQAFPRADATASAVPDLAHRRFGHLDLVDVVSENEGEFVGYHLGVPFDWDTLDPDLMYREEERFGR